MTFSDLYDLNTLYQSVVAAGGAALVVGLTVTLISSVLWR